MVSLAGHTVAQGRSDSTVNVWTNAIKFEYSVYSTYSNTDTKNNVAAPASVSQCECTYCKYMSAVLKKAKNILGTSRPRNWDHWSVRTWLFPQTWPSLVFSKHEEHEHVQQQSYVNDVRPQRNEPQSFGWCCACFEAEGLLWRKLQSRQFLLWTLNRSN